MEEAYDSKMRDALARSIKKAYTERKSSLLGRLWKPSSRHQSFKLWQNAADQAIRLNAPAESYVYAAFYFCPMTTGPFPNMMSGRASERWWKEYVKINPDYQKEVEYYEELGIPSEVWYREPALREIQEEVAFVRQTLFVMTGDKQWPPLNLENLEIVRTPIIMMRPHIRLILVYPDEYVRKYYAEEILENFEKRPDVFRAMERLGFEMIEVMAWLRQT